MIHPIQLLPGRTLIENGIDAVILYTASQSQSPCIRRQSIWDRGRRDLKERSLNLGDGRDQSSVA